MAFKMDQPLYSLSDEQEQKDIIDLWEKEKHGGISAGNNRLPYPLTWLIALIILTAFMITMPIWGQRPNVETYLDFVAVMDSPEVQKLATGPEKMKYITQYALDHAKDGRQEGQIERHPLTWLDLQNIAPAIKEVQAAGGKYALDNYSIMGDHIALANFEGNMLTDPKTGKEYRERVQPWWDKGYTIDVFYVTYFLILIVVICKRLPHFTHKPDMSKAK